MAKNAEILSRGSASVAIPGRVGNFDFSNQYANYDENGVCMLVAGPIENLDLANKNPLIPVYVKNESGKTISISSFEKCLFIMLLYNKEEQITRVFSPNYCILALGSL